MVLSTLVASALLAAAPAPSKAPDLCAAGKAPKSLLQSLTCAALDSVNRSDPAALSALMADDFAMTTASGRFLPNAKAMLVERWTALSAQGEAASSSLLDVRLERVDGDVGIVAGRIEDRTERAGSVGCSTHAFTDVWTRRGGRWFWTLSHESGGAPAPCRSGAAAGAK